MICSNLQAIEAAIELNLRTVEAGAQGEHKIQRGYLPVTTYSCHYLMNEGFRIAIQDFLDREAAQVIIYISLSCALISLSLSLSLISLES